MILARQSKILTRRFECSIGYIVKKDQLMEMSSVDVCTVHSTYAISVSSLDNERFQQAVYQLIVVPLIDYLQAFKKQ